MVFNIEIISRNDNNFTSIKFVWKSMSEDKSIEDKNVVCLCMSVWVCG